MNHVFGFENDTGLDGGLAVTGNYPGRARNAEELRQDLDFALSLIPGKKRLNLHSIYAEHGAKKVERNELTIEQFANWLDWASDRKLGLDFNPSFFSHPLAQGATLTSSDEKIRQFWIEHGIACRKIGEAFGKKLGTPCVTNVWIPDGSKDTPFDRLAPRQRLVDSLDKIFAQEIDKNKGRADDYIASLLGQMGDIKGEASINVEKQESIAEENTRIALGDDEI